VKHGKFPSTFVNDYETFTDKGYNVQASYVLTGEDSSYYGVKPYHPFDPVESGSWGAFEIAARVGSLAADSGKFKLGFASPSLSARTATEYGVALNWYLSQNVKWQLDYVRTFFDKGGLNNTDRRDESAVITQLQVAF
jgi:phosphate-selective porin OprO/OprP